MTLALSFVVALAAAATPTPPASKDAVGTLHAEARRIVEEWRDAQNRADEKAYTALYEQKRFRGVKRASKGTTRYDWAGWSTDRLRMMKTRPTVAIEKLTVVTWLEKKALKQGIIEVRFLQRWKNARYADHGIKLLLLVRNESGGLRILYEDLLDSHAGLENGKSRWSDAARASAGKSSASLADAWQKLNQKAPTLAQVDAALDALAASDDADLLARAIVANANGKCIKVDRSSECGDERIEWAQLEPALPWSDPCVQRKALLWAFAGWTPTKRQLAPLREAMLALMKLPPPEEELIESALEVARAVDPELLYDLLSALVDANRAELANQHLKGLTPAQLADAANYLSLDGAALLLDGKTQRADIVRAFADTDLSVTTRQTLWSTVIAWKGKDVEAALVAAAEGRESCALAMNAASELASRGRPQWLPKRKPDSSADDLAWALCRSQHDEDAQRRRALWTSVLSSKVKVVDHLDDDFAERDEQGNKLEREDQVSTLRRATSLPQDLDEVFGAGAAPECRADSCEVQTGDGYYRVTFSVGKDGKRYIDEIYRYQWRGCPC